MGLRCGLDALEHSINWWFRHHVLVRKNHVVRAATPIDSSE